LGNDQPVTVKLFDLNGKLWSTETIDVFAEPAVDIRALVPGLYIAEISNGAKTQHLRFITE
jgi:hypothetical protein